MAAIVMAGIIPSSLAFRRGEMVATERHDAGEERGGRARLTAVRGSILGIVGGGIVMSTLGHVLKAEAGSAISIGSVVLGVASLNGILLAARHLVGIVGGPALGAAIDRVGVGTGEAVSLAGCALALLAASLSSSVLTLACAIVALAVCETGAFVALTTQASRTSRDYARFATAVDMGSAAGPLLGWMLIETVSLGHAGLATGSLLYAVGLGVALLSRLRSARACTSPPPRRGR
jgi:hypothetical protein